MGTTTFFANCPSRTVLEVLANKWTLYVLAALREGPCRFNELRRILDGVTQKMLTQTLRALERDGLVRREVFATVPLRVEYSLTELGVGAGRLTSAIGDWSKRHAGEIVAARVEYDRHADAEPRPLPSH
ncbi:MAG: helix-turn-helix domain-containing protein [Actinocatenispora sp.]